MKNKLSDLNDHLFAQIERLGDEDLNKEQLDKEISRSKSMTSVASEIISNGRLGLDAQKEFREAGGIIDPSTTPTLLQ